MDYYEYVGPDPITKSVSCSDFHTCNPQNRSQNEMYIQPEYMSGSDYCNGLINRANYESFLQSFGKVEGVHCVIGGYGTFGVAIRADIAESNDDIADTLRSLEDYPVIDEDAYREKETEAQNEAYEDWGRSDTIRFISRELNKHDIDWDEPEDLGAFDHLFYDACEQTNEYWQEETGGSMWIRVERVGMFIAENILIDMTPEKELPLLMNRKWCSEKIRAKFENKLKGVSNG